jgi:hypothetical protein
LNLCPSNNWNHWARRYWISPVRLIWIDGYGLLVRSYRNRNQLAVLQNLTTSGFCDHDISASRFHGFFWVEEHISAKMLGFKNKQVSIMY